MGETERDSRSKQLKAGILSANILVSDRLRSIWQLRALGPDPSDPSDLSRPEAQSQGSAVHPRLVSMIGWPVALLWALMCWEWVVEDRGGTRSIVQYRQTLAKCNPTVQGV